MPRATFSSGDSQRFGLTRCAYDAIHAHQYIAIAEDIVPQARVSYLFTGVYNAAAQTMSLYVDRQLQQTVYALAPRSPAGPLVVGRGFLNGAPTDWGSGTVDDVSAFSALSS